MRPSSSYLAYQVNGRQVKIDRRLPDDVWHSARNFIDKNTTPDGLLHISYSKLKRGLSAQLCTEFNVPYITVDTSDTGKVQNTININIDDTLYHVPKNVSEDVYNVLRGL